MDRQLRSSRAMVTAGGLVFVALIGSRLLEGLWLALLPAAALLALGLAGVRGLPHQPLPVRAAAVALALASAALVGLAIVGLFLQRSLGMEPSWLTRAVSWTGWAFLAGTVAYGAAAGLTRSLSRAVSVLVASSLLLGLAIDQALARVLGSFFHGNIGSYLGLGLFGFALVAIGRQVGGRDAAVGSRSGDGAGEASAARAGRNALLPSLTRKR